MPEVRDPNLRGSNNLVIDNKAEKNDGKGLSNKGTNTTWDGHSLKKNRIDLANAGTVTATNHKTGGTTTPP